MRMRPFDYLEPEDLPQALEALSEHGSEAALLAGGTDLLVMLKSGSIRPSVVVNIKRLAGLDQIARDDGGLRLGPLVTIRTVETSEAIQGSFPALSDSASVLGSLQIRHLATLGGNLCRAAPCAETAPPLMALGAQVRLVGQGSERSLPLEGFFTGPGETVLAPDEILIEIIVPPPERRSGAAYFRHSIRPMMDLAVVNVAAWVLLDPSQDVVTEAKVILGSVAPTVIRSPRAEAILRGQPVSDGVINSAAEAAAEESLPITDVRATDQYRREMVRLFARRALLRAIERAKGGNGHS